VNEFRGKADRFLCRVECLANENQAVCCVIWL